MARKKRVLTPEEIEARLLTEVWNSPLKSTKLAEIPPLLSGVPWFDSEESFNGHSPACSCDECFHCHCYAEAAR